MVMHAHYLVALLIYGVTTFVTHTHPPIPYTVLLITVGLGVYL